MSRKIQDGYISSCDKQIIFFEMRLLFHISSFFEEMTHVVPYLDKRSFVRWPFRQLLSVFVL